jgi:23S rRNA (cytidine1920-2'-O)/16S rRNA (cytidine1409-2'-O)-methyltransferase
VLLERGAAKVYAVDVGHGQLHEDIKNDARVVALEGCDARLLTRDKVRDAVGAIVADVSFISLSKALGPALILAAPGAWLVALVKPQFEVGRERLGKGGIVRDEGARRSAVEAVTAWLAAQPGWRIAGVIPSPSRRVGRREFLVGALLMASLGRRCGNIGPTSRLGAREAALPRRPQGGVRALSLPGERVQADA